MCCRILVISLCVPLLTLHWVSPLQMEIKIQLLWGSNRQWMQCIWQREDAPYTFALLLPLPPPLITAQPWEVDVPPPNWRQNDGPGSLSPGEYSSFDSTLLHLNCILHRQRRATTDLGARDGFVFPRSHWGASCSTTAVPSEGWKQEEDIVKTVLNLLSQSTEPWVQGIGS